MQSVHACAVQTHFSVFALLPEKSPKMPPKSLPKAPKIHPKSVDPRSNVFSEPVGGIGFTLSPYPLSLLGLCPARWQKTRKNTYKLGKTSLKILVKTHKNSLNIARNTHICAYTRTYTHIYVKTRINCILEAFESPHIYVKTGIKCIPGVS